MSTIQHPPGAGGTQVPGGHGAGPDTASDALGGFETRLLAALQTVVAGRAVPAGQPARPGRSRARWGLAGAGLTAAALAVAVTVAATGGAPAARHASRPLTATELAYRAAPAAARQPDVRPGQWVYRKYLTKGSRPAITEFWTTADSVKAAWVSAILREALVSGPGSKP